MWNTILIQNKVIQLSRIVIVSLVIKLVPHSFNNNMKRARIVTSRDN